MGLRRSSKRNKAKHGSQKQTRISDYDESEGSSQNIAYAALNKFIDSSESSTDTSYTFVNSDRSREKKARSTVEYVSSNAEAKIFGDKDKLRKHLKNLGKSFVNKKGKMIPAKQMKSPCICLRKCFDTFTEEKRLEIFRKYWTLGDKHKQWQFLIKYTKKEPTKRSLTAGSFRKHTFIYFLPLNNTESKLVCQTMFLNTLSTCFNSVATAWKKYDGNRTIDIDKRGKFKRRYTTK